MHPSSGRNCACKHLTWCLPDACWPEAPFANMSAAAKWQEGNGAAGNSDCITQGLL